MQDRTDMTQDWDANRSKMRHDGSRDLFDYWSAMRGGRVAPFKSEVTARGVGRTLASNVFILEALGGGDMRFRLAGEALYRIFGIELRGMSALSIVVHDNRDELRALIETALSRPGVGLAHLTAETQAGALCELEVVFAPLKSDFNEMNRLLGAVHVVGEDDLEAEARRCRVDGVHLLTLDQEQPEETAPLAGFAEDQTPFGAPPTLKPALKATLKAVDGSESDGASDSGSGGERRRGHLRLVKD